MAVIEARKMEMSIPSEVDDTIFEIKVEVGQAVEAD